MEYGMCSKIRMIFLLFQSVWRPWRPWRVSYTTMGNVKINSIVRCWSLMAYAIHGQSHTIVHWRTCTIDCNTLVLQHVCVNCIERLSKCALLPTYVAVRTSIHVYGALHTRLRRKGSSLIETLTSMKYFRIINCIFLADNHCYSHIWSRKDYQRTPLKMGAYLTNFEFSFFKTQFSRKGWNAWKKNQERMLADAGGVLDSWKLQFHVHDCLKMSLNYFCIVNRKSPFFSPSILLIACCSGCF